MAEMMRRGSVEGPTPHKPDSSLLSPITPREQANGADEADTQGFKVPTAPACAGKDGAHGKKTVGATKGGRKRAKPAAKSKSSKKKRRPMPASDDSDDSDDDLSVLELKRKPASPVVEEPGPKKHQALAASRDFDVGARVVLAPNVSIAGKHVLSDGAQGVVLEVEHDPDDDEPYKVVGKDGTTYWYEVGHLAAAPVSGSSAENAPEEPVTSAAVGKQTQNHEPAAQEKTWLDEGLESRLLGLADDDDDGSEAESDGSPVRNTRHTLPASSSDDENDDVAATLTYSPAMTEENEASHGEQPEVDQPWELVNTWITIEFDALKHKKGKAREWHDCLVVDYDRATSQHLVKWAEDGKEEWLPTIKSGEFKPAESQAKQKCKEVVFDNNVKLPPVEKPELVGCTYKVIKPVKINSGQSRDSSDVGTCRPGDIIKVLKACVLNGQLRVMYHRGWTSVTSRKGAKFLLKTKSVLHVTKEDKRAMRKVEKRAKEEEERQSRDHLERHKAATALTESWVAACAKAELRSQKQTAAAAAALNGDSSGAPCGTQDQWRKKRRHALTGADDSDEEDNDDAVTQEETEDLYNKVNAQQKAQETTSVESSVPKLTGLQALFAKRASSASTLQSVVRAAHLRREFLARREAALGIQALVRGMLARDEVFEIRMDLIAKLKAEKAKKLADAKSARAAKARQRADEAAAKAAAEAELAAAAEIDWEDFDDSAITESGPSTQQRRQQQQQQQQQQAGTTADGIDWDAVDLQQMDLLASQHTVVQQTNESPAEEDPFANMDDEALAALEGGVSSQ